MILQKALVIALLSAFAYVSNGLLPPYASSQSSVRGYPPLNSFVASRGVTNTDLARKCTLLASKTDSPQVETNIRGKAALALTALVVQNSALALLMRLSRVTAKARNNMYIVSTAVVLSELIKIIVSLVGCFLEDSNGDMKLMGENIKKSSKLSDLIKISVPAALYVLQNNLQYVAMSNLPAEVYQVLIQGKIITTALFSVILLNKRYSLIQWGSVFALSLGVALVQFSLRTSVVAASHVNFPIGITSVLVSTLTSGFASIFLEKVLKSKGGFWVKNIQLSLMSFFIASVGSIIKDSGSIASRGFFVGYDPLVLSVILTQALGGMLVAFVVRYTNSIVKGFAASGSIVLSCLVSALFLNDYKLNAMFTLGTGMVCASALTWAVSPTVKNVPQNIDNNGANNSKEIVNADQLNEIKGTATTDSLTAIVLLDEIVDSKDKDKDIKISELELVDASHIQSDALTSGGEGMQ